MEASINTSKRLEKPNKGGQWQRPNQERPGGDNGRGVNAVSGGGREGGDDVEWVGKARHTLQ